MNVTLNGVTYRVTKTIAADGDYLVLTPLVPSPRTTLLALRIPR